jgi:hypothetical protein
MAENWRKMGKTVILALILVNKFFVPFSVKIPFHGIFNEHFLRIFFRGKERKIRLQECMNEWHYKSI